jgi:hypothetical protein
MRNRFSAVRIIVDRTGLSTTLLQAAIVDGAAANSIATTGGLQLIIGS